MRKTFVVAMAALMTFATAVTAAAPQAEAAKGRKTALGVGVVLGLAGAALLANSAQASEKQRRFARYCKGLYRKCVNGSNYSCQKYETGGCTE